MVLQVLSDLIIIGDLALIFDMNTALIQNNEINFEGLCPLEGQSANERWGAFTSVKLISHDLNDQSIFINV